MRVKNLNVFPLYLSFYLDRPESRNWLSTHAIGTNMPNLNTGILSSVPISLPNLDEQIKIAKFLQNIEEKTQYNNCINDNLQQMAYLTYMHTFYGKTPNGYLKDIIIEQSKSVIQVNEAKGKNGDIPFFTSGGAILKWTVPLIDDRCCFLNTGGNADVKFYVGKSAYSTDTWCITANRNLSDYLYLLLLSIKPELDKKFFQGTGLKHLQKPLLKERAIYIPNDDEIKAFNSKVEPYFDMISDNIRENQQLISLRDWLLPMLMNGQATIAD